MIGGVRVRFRHHRPVWVELSVIFPQQPGPTAGQQVLAHVLVQLGQSTLTVSSTARRLVSLSSFW